MRLGMNDLGNIAQRTAEQENSGLDRLEVRDNGCGITEQDAAFMARPHYTSKITDMADLAHLATYGFRGEALGSLCSVSTVSVTSKTACMDVAMTYTFTEKGEISTCQPSHLGQGTTVTACNLFKALPVRRQFYSTAKKRKDELRKVEDLVTSFSIIRHDVRFSLRHNKEVLWQTNPVASPKDVLIRVLGAGVMRCMECLKKKDMESESELLLYVPQASSSLQLCSRTSNDRCFIYINQRPVQHKGIEKLLRSHYCNAMQCSGRCPLAFVSVTVPPDEVDVNLEPNKTKVLLHEKNELLKLLQGILEDIYGEIEAKSSEQTSKSSLDLSVSLDEIITKKSDKDKTEANEDERTNHNKDEKSSNLKISFYNPSESDLPQAAEVPDVSRLTTADAESSCDTVDSSSEVKCFPLSTARPVVKVPEKYQRPASNGEVLSVDGQESVQNDPTDPGLPALAEGGTSVSSSVNFIKQSDIGGIYDIKPNIDENSNDNKLHGEALGDTSSVISTQQVCFDLGGSDFLTSTPLHNAVLQQDRTDQDLPQLGQESDSFLQVVQRAESAHKSGVSAEDVEPQNKYAFNTSHDDIERNSTIGNTHNIPTGNSGAQGGRGTTHDNIGSVDNLPGWSRGNSLVNAAGQPIQPVALLAAGGGMDVSPGPPLDNMDIDTPTSMHTSSLIKTPGSTTKILDQSDQPTLYDYVGDHPIKRPSSAYIHFCKEARPKVYEDNPGATFDKVARLMSEQWTSMSDDEKQVYTDMAKADSSRYQDQRSQQKAARKSLPTAVKRRKLETTLSSPVLKSKKRSSLTSADKKTQVPIIPVRFSMQHLNDLFANGFQPSQLTDTSKGLRFIGQLKSHGVWLGVEDNKLKGFHPIRAQEMLIYSSLLANHKLAPETISEPIYLRPCYIGGDEMWSTLTSLNFSETSGVNFYHHITDTRITDNGIDIRRGKDDVSGKMTLDLVGLSQLVNFLGVNDLKEILSLLHADRQLPLEKCRPGKIKHYLQSEAVRMARQLPQRVSREEAEDLLAQIQECDSYMCFHDKPCLFTIYDLDNVNTESLMHPNRVNIMPADALATNVDRASAAGL